jgi:LCP family protein required for cell wall assembly
MNGAGNVKLNKGLIIWICIFLVIGALLLAVACETDSSDPKQQYADEYSGSLPDGLEDESEDRSTDKDAENDAAGDTENNEEKVRVNALTAGEPYPDKLVEADTRNLLIIGQDKVSNLYDTIGIANIDKNNKVLKVIMIPRDTYIEYSEGVLDKLGEKINLHEPGIYKINFAHQVGNYIDYEGKFDSGPISFLADVVKEKFGVEVDDFVKINVSGFRKMVDYLGGVDIYVLYDMNYDDPTQDLHIHIKKGKQHLDGKAAEGFVRFRQGYKEDGSMLEIGDGSRKKNQLTFIKELIKQKGTIKNIGKIPGLLSLLGKNVQHSIGVGDMLTSYIGIAKDVISDEYDIVTENLFSEKQIRIDGAAYITFE